MPAEVQVGPHRVFVRSKLRKTIIDKVFQGNQRLFACDGPVEILQIAWVIVKTLVD